MTKLKQDGTMQKENTMHTPTPRLKECNLLELKKGEYDIYTPEFRSPTCKAYSFEKAKFIVRAVNAHEELVRALKNVLNAGRGSSGRIILDYKQEQEVSKALAKAEGKS